MGEAGKKPLVVTGEKQQLHHPHPFKGKGSVLLDTA